jgi:hypothetical protein
LYLRVRGAAWLRSSFDETMKTAITYFFAASALALFGQDTNSVSNGRLDELVAEKGSPVIYDKQVGEYQLVWTNHVAGNTIIHQVPLSFDPFTGKELRSRREELFAEPSEAEQKIVFKKLRNCRGIDDLIKEFGKPDRVWPKDKDTGYSQYDFEKQFETLKLTVRVAQDGSLVPIVTGKQIKNSIQQ